MTPYKTNLVSKDQPIAFIKFIKTYQWMMAFDAGNIAVTDIYLYVIYVVMIIIILLSLLNK